MSSSGGGSGLPTTGGTLTGPLAMSGNKITGLANGTAASDVAAFGQVPVSANGYGVTGNTGLTPTPAVDLSTVESYISAAVNGFQAITNLTSVSLAAGTWVITGRAALINTTGPSAPVTVFIGPTSASATSAYASASGVLGELSGGYAYCQSLSVTKTVVLASATTVYLEAACSTQAVNAIATDEAGLGIGNQTGITAVRIA